MTSPMQPQTVQHTIRWHSAKLSQHKGTRFFAQTETAQVGRTSSAFSINSDKFLVWQSTVDGNIQIVVPPPLRQPTLIVSHHSQIAEHPGQRRMYNTIRCIFYWLHMVANVDYIVSISSCCATTSPRYCHRCKWQLLSASGQLEFDSRDIVRPFSHNNAMYSEHHYHCRSILKAELS